MFGHSRSQSNPFVKGEDFNKRRTSIIYAQDIFINALCTQRWLAKHRIPKRGPLSPLILGAKHCQPMCAFIVVSARRLESLILQAESHVMLSARISPFDTTSSR